MNLKRNYEENPLKKGEYPEVEDVKYLFLELNLSRQECAEICNCNPEKIKIVCQANNFKKTKEQRTEVRNRTNLKKYGCTNISQLKIIKEKKKKTALKNYGVDNPAKSKKVWNKIKKNNLKKYGVESTNSLKETKDKIKNTIQEKYGVDNIMQVFTCKEKQKQTCIEKYGCENAMQNTEIQEKQKQTNLERYGNKSVYGSQYFQQKTKETLMEKYGVENPMQVFTQNTLSPEALKIKQKIIDNIPNMIKKSNKTKRKNKSFNTSKIEKDLYNLLLTKYPNTINGYYEHPIYKFNCDFYIPELDLLIEYNGIWTHGGMPFENNKECLKQLKIWKEKAKTSKFYENAIETWTIRDVNKQRIAKENNLNYLMFYNKQEFMKWYNSL